MANLLNTLINSIKHWYVPLILGILFLVFGIYIFTVPLETYVTLSILFSISFITSGLFEIFFSIQNSKTLSGWGWYLVGGLFSLTMGVYLVIYPGISIVILPFIVGFTVMFRSFQLLGIAFDMCIRYCFFVHTFGKPNIFRDFNCNSNSISIYFYWYCVNYSFI